MQVIRCASDILKGVKSACIHACGMQDDRGLLQKLITSLSRDPDPHLESLRSCSGAACWSQLPDGFSCAEDQQGPGFKIGVQMHIIPASLGHVRRTVT